MSLALVHILIHAFHTPFRRLPSISMVQKNTLPYSYSHTVTCTVARKLYTHRHTVQQHQTYSLARRLHIASDYALYMFVTYFDLIPTASTAFDRFGTTRAHTLAIQHSYGFPSLRSPSNCSTSVLILFPKQYNLVTSKSPELRPLEVYARHVRSPCTLTSYASLSHASHSP